MAASALGTVGDIRQFGDHRSFNYYTVPGSMDLFSGGRPPSHGQGFQIYQHGSKYPTNDVARAISPKNMFGDDNLHSTHGWLPNSQLNWKMHPASLGQLIPSQPQNHPDLFTRNYAREPNQIIHCDSGYETWDEPARSLPQNGLSRRQSSEGVMIPSPRSLSLKGAKMSRTESERWIYSSPVCLNIKTNIGSSGSASILIFEPQLRWSVTRARHQILTSIKARFTIYGWLTQLHLSPSPRRQGTEHLSVFLSRRTNSE